MKPVLIGTAILGLKGAGAKEIRFTIFDGTPKRALKAFMKNATITSSEVVPGASHDALKRKLAELQSIKDALDAKPPVMTSGTFAPRPREKK